MSYIDLVNKFWRLNQNSPCSGSEVTLYFFLLHYCNSQMWKNPFELSTKEIERQTGMSRPTITKARTKLFEKGFLDFFECEGSAKNVYFLTSAEVSENDLFTLICVKNFYTICVKFFNTIQYCLKFCVKNLNKKLYTNENYTYLGKDYIRLYTSTNKKTATSKEGNPGVFLEVEKLKKKRAWIESICMTHRQSQEEVLKWLDLFPHHCVSEGVEEHKDEKDAMKHFSSFLRIKLSSQSKGNGKQHEDRFAERRGFVPEVEVRKGFKGTL